MCFPHNRRIVPHFFPEISAQLAFFPHPVRWHDQMACTFLLHCLAHSSWWHLKYDIHQVKIPRWCAVTSWCARFYVISSSLPPLPPPPPRPTIFLHGAVLHFQYGTPSYLLRNRKHFPYFHHLSLIGWATHSV